MADRELIGAIEVLQALLTEAFNVIATIEPESTKEGELLTDLKDRMKAAALPFCRAPDAQPISPHTAEQGEA